MGKIKVYFKNFKVPQLIAEYTLLFLISVIFLMLFSLWTSPFYKNWYGCDASFFTLVGRGITHGKIMYRDYYDLKGPYFFFIEALGQFICKGRMGAFIVQLAALYASVLLIWKTCLLFINKAKSAFVLFIFFLGHIATLWGGNTLEEYFLPFSLLCLYMVCREYINDSGEISTLTSFILGLSLGLMIFSKISISGTVLGIAAGAAFLMLSKKRYRELFEFVIYAVLGLLVAFFPIIVYYSYHNCLTDMLNCVFVTGFKRSKDFAETFNITWELKCSGAVFAFIFAVTHKKRCDGSLCTILMAMSAATYLLLHLGTPFYYYFTSVYPCLILALCLMLSAYDPMLLFESRKQALSLVLLAVYLVYYIQASMSTVRVVMYDRSNEFHETYLNDSKAIAEFIPVNERDQVFSYMLDMQWYEINHILPCNRYIVNLPFFIALDENVLPELTEYMTKTPPKWLVIASGFDEELPEIAPMVYEKYTCIYENTVGGLYLLD